MVWFQEIGVGYLHIEPTNNSVYDEEYFKRYEAQADTEIGRRLMDIRVSQVNSVARYSQVVDVGIGCGRFIEERNRTDKLTIRTFGYDINPFAVRWLLDRGLFVDPYKYPVDAITLWDVLEHIPNFAPLLRQVRKYVFISIPIFQNAEHARRSKHYRPAEHCWYFTERGLINVMSMHGFRLIEQHREETHAGREDIGSFTFMRRV